MYVSFSESTWKRWFDNDVQYINLTQRSEWLGLFQRNGFNLIDETSSRIDIHDLPLANRCNKMDRSDLECVYFKLLLRKML